jgi:hypothetical protein
MKKNRNPASLARRELLATTMLATLAMSPMVLGALAQTADQSPTEGGAIAVPTVEVTATEGGGGGPAESGGSLTGRSPSNASKSIKRSAQLASSMPIRRRSRPAMCSTSPTP